MSSSRKVLIVDDEERIRTILRAILSEEGYDVSLAKDGAEAVDLATLIQPQLAIIDLQMPRMDGLQTCTELSNRLPNLVTIILTAHGSIPSAVNAIRQGVYDYVTKPFDNDQLLAVIERGFEHYDLKEEVKQLKQVLGKEHGADRIIGESEIIKRLREEIHRIAQTDATLLIEGESGTGKELAARAVHYESRRKDCPMIVVDCGAIPQNLVESEFFGHERGAFTDAREMRLGKFEEADKGTLFLDEIGELPLDSQTKLLRVLQEKEFSRVGSATPIRVDVRVIAATNKKLEEQVKAGEFREDLFYRLNVLRLATPSLRDHREDIPVYVRHFLSKYRNEFGKTISRATDDALELLVRHDWKGNIRELENAIQRAMLRSEGELLTASDFSDTLSPILNTRPVTIDDGLEVYIRSLTDRTEREVILEALTKTNGNRTAAAQKLKISRKTLFNKMQQYGLE